MRIPSSFYYDPRAGIQYIAEPPHATSQSQRQRQSSSAVVSIPTHTLTEFSTEQIQETVARVKQAKLAISSNSSASPKTRLRKLVHTTHPSTINASTAGNNSIQNHPPAKDSIELNFDRMWKTYTKNLLVGAEGLAATHTLLEHINTPIDHFSVINKMLVAYPYNYEEQQNCLSFTQIAAKIVCPHITAMLPLNLMIRNAALTPIEETVQSVFIDKFIEFYIFLRDEYPQQLTQFLENSQTSSVATTE